MSDLPKKVHVHEEGPREGFQIEPGPIPTSDKIRLIEALAETGLQHIQACSFVSPRVVPQWADA
ncbi:MAG: hydroxymethylglutaryl-CoA lyase, partial [Hyphomicrobiaceae bacterium]